MLYSLSRSHHLYTWSEVYPMASHVRLLWLVKTFSLWTKKVPLNSFSVSTIGKNSSSVKLYCVWVEFSLFAEEGDWPVICTVTAPSYLLTRRYVSQTIWESLDIPVWYFGYFVLIDSKACWWISFLSVAKVNFGAFIGNPLFCKCWSTLPSLSRWFSNVELERINRSSRYARTYSKSSNKMVFSWNTSGVVVAHSHLQSVIAKLPLLDVLRLISVAYWESLSYMQYSRLFRKWIRILCYSFVQLSKVIKELYCSL